MEPCERDPHKHDRHEEVTSLLQCPVCRELLLRSPGGYRCPKNHTFDAARQGYVNFLLAHKKHSREPGDSPDMIQSRRTFLNLGRYDAVSDGINAVVAAHLPHDVPGRIRNVLDAGCGEGFYLARLKEFFTHDRRGDLPIGYYGVDISKYAVRRATQRDKTVSWFVASVNDLPFLPASVDIVLNIFSPPNTNEFARILRNTGTLIIAGPGPRHLNGLRAIIYPVAREHKQPDPAERSNGPFSLITETRINYRIELRSREEIMALLSMTPYFWNIDLQTKAGVEALDRLALDVDVKISVYGKRRA